MSCKSVGECVPVCVPQMCTSYVYRICVPHMCTSDTCQLRTPHMLGQLKAGSHHPVPPSESDAAVVSSDGNSVVADAAEEAPVPVERWRRRWAARSSGTAEVAALSELLSGEVKSPSAVRPSPPPKTKGTQLHLCGEVRQEHERQSTMR